mmetsp:Transcript_13881/g.27448  ORF Transcript_13881/g.27448 Transcript_13881/m.27448 type:complete len:209 (-) Transcript_13881:513-1139(-)
MASARFRAFQPSTPTLTTPPTSKSHSPSWHTSTGANGITATSIFWLHLSPLIARSTETTRQGNGQAQMLSAPRLSRRLSSSNWFGCTLFTSLRARTPSTPTRQGRTKSDTGQMGPFMLSTSGGRSTLGAWRTAAWSLERQMATARVMGHTSRLKSLLSHSARKATSSATEASRMSTGSSCSRLTPHSDFCKRQATRRSLQTSSSASVP